MNTKFSQRLKERLVQLNSPNLKYTTIIHFARVYGLNELTWSLKAFKSDLFTPPAVIYEVESIVNIIKTLRDLDWKDRLFYLAYFRDAKANAKVFTPDDARVLYVLENAYDIITRGAELPEKPPRTILDDVQEFRELNHLKTLMRDAGKAEIDKHLIRLRADRAHPKTTLDVDQQRTLYILERNYRDITGEHFPQLEFREPIVENNHEINQTAKAFLKQIPRREKYHKTPWAETLDNTKLYIPQLMFYGIEAAPNQTLGDLISWRRDTFCHDEENYKTLEAEDQVYLKVRELLKNMRPKDAMEYLEEYLDTYTPSHFKSPQHAAATLLSGLILVMSSDCDFVWLEEFEEFEIVPAPIEDYEW